jgi:antitoxin (DNA-binding transcriptional repressor) of toxin-antitoxin stability system
MAAWANTWRHRPSLATECYARHEIMSRRITQRESRDASAAVLRDAQAGETFTVTRNGTPLAELSPVSPRRFVPLGAPANARARVPRVDFGRLRSDLDAVARPFTDE